MIDTNATTGARGFLKRLAQNEAGNTLAIVAAALVPMVAMVGGGVDISRGYMAQARLQQACDAAVLAGRKAAGDGNFNDDAESRARTFFDANFPEGFQSTTDRSFEPGSLDGGTTVTATASATMPTVVMQIFGKKKINLTATCDARLEVNNSDVMMVLDTTGSMVCTPAMTVAECGAYINTNGLVETSGSRIVGLRAALVSFNGILDAAAAGTNVRIRYGFVPYSGTANVGKLLHAQDPDYLIGGNSGDTNNYQSRRPVYFNPTGSPSNSTETYNPSTTRTEFTTSTECNKWAINESNQYIYWTGSRWQAVNFTPSTTGNPTLISGVRRTYSFNSLTGTSPGAGYFPTCRRNVVTQSGALSYVPVSGSVFSHYEHANLAWPVSDYVEAGIANDTITFPGDNQLSSPRQVQWAGCIEERDTVNSATFTFNSASGTITPAAANDLDIDGEPTNNATRWRPYWPEMTYWRNVTGAENHAAGPIASQDDSEDYKSQVACPQEAQLLTEMTTADFATYTDSLFANGGTYHNVGAIWGARLASPDGIFADNVNEEPENSSFVSRHMIIMTDGQIDTGSTYYSMYGVDRHDLKISTDGVTDLNARHEARFSAMCEAVKAKGIRIWVIAFSTGLSTALTNCASATGENADGTIQRATYSSSNSAALNTAFVEIAQSIADLRLSK
jgi:Flp pilus assembly protein TadG